MKDMCSCDSISSMASSLVRLRDKLGSDSEYFAQVYNYTFEFSRAPGQRSLGMCLWWLTSMADVLDNSSYAVFQGLIWRKDSGLC